MAQLQSALEAHELSDRWIDVVQSVGIGVCAVGIIVSCLALIYVALLLRGAASTLTRDLRQLMLRVAALEEKHDQTE